METSVVTPETLELRALIDARRDALKRLFEKYSASRPLLFGSVAQGTASAGSDIDILVQMDPADGNLLMRASGLMEEARELFGTTRVDVFPEQLLKHRVSASAVEQAVPL